MGKVQGRNWSCLHLSVHMLSLPGLGQISESVIVIIYNHTETVTDRVQLASFTLWAQQSTHLASLQAPYCQNTLPSTRQTKSTHLPVLTLHLGPGTTRGISTCISNSISCQLPHAPVKNQTRPAAHPQGLQEPPVPEGWDLTDIHSNTRKDMSACGCFVEDHRFHLENCSPNETPIKGKKKKSPTKSTFY